MPDPTTLADRVDQEAYQQWCDEHRRPQVLPPDTEPVWIIRYQDQDISDEVFAGEDAEKFARRRFDQQRNSWSLSLFQEVARG